MWEKSAETRQILQRHQQQLLHFNLKSKGMDSVCRTFNFSMNTDKLVNASCVVIVPWYVSTLTFGYGTFIFNIGVVAVFLSFSFGWWKQNEMAHWIEFRTKLKLNLNESETCKKSASTHFKCIEVILVSIRFNAEKFKQNVWFFFSILYQQFVYVLYDVKWMFTHLPFQQHNQTNWWKRMLKAFHCLLLSYQLFCPLWHILFGAWKCELYGFIIFNAFMALNGI